MKIENQNGKSNLVFVCDQEEFSGVQKIAGKVCQDVSRVTGAMPELVFAADYFMSEKKAEATLFFGTLGKSDFIEKEAAKDSALAAKIDFIRDKREVYLFSVKGNQIIIVGSDKRGTIYGLFHLSELMGVSPLVDWAGFMPLKKESFELKDEVFASKEPSVRFRGFFINDEWPAYGNWTNKRFGGFNAKMYEHVFELLLRMKGNYLWPAMWSARFSDDGPGLANAELADELGVIMGASHHEPCCRAGEEYKYLRGPGSIYGDAWNFRSNQEGITKFWEDGLKRSGKFENVITVGMRGEADTAIMKNATLADNINLLRDVLKTQNSLIKKYVNEDLDKVPRMLALYKEVEPYFYGDKHTKGLMDDPELEGVTLMLCDDNHGNLRTVPTEHMRSHKGGYGMYYHFDYHGSPFSYEWMNTNYLPKVKEQMTAAYDFGIRDLWIVNMGDIFSNEFPLNYFLDLAYDYEKYSDLEFTTQEYTRLWIEFNFAGLSKEILEKIEFIINNYTKLAHMRRTECIWPETFAPVTFGEADGILARAQAVLDACQELKDKIPQETYPAFFAQVYMPACGDMNILKMQILTGKNHWYAKHGIIIANAYVDKIRACLDFDKKLVDELDKVDNGRWYGMGWSEHIGFTNWNEEEAAYPLYMTTDGSRKGRLAVWVDGKDIVTCGQDWSRKWLLIDDFKNPEINEAVIKVAPCGGGDFRWEVDSDLPEDNPWFSLEVKKNYSDGIVDEKFAISDVIVRLDRNKLIAAQSKTANITIKSDDGHGGRILVNIKVDANVPDEALSTGAASNIFVQTLPYISIEAPHFVKASSEMKVLEGYGKTLGAVKAFPLIKSYLDKKGRAITKDAPFAEYHFVLNSDYLTGGELSENGKAKDGIIALDFYLNPSNPAYKDNRLAFVAEVNGEKILKDAVDPAHFAVGDNQEPWGHDVTNDIRVATVYASARAGENVLRFYPATPNIVLEKIVIHAADFKMPYSYLGAPETFRR